MTINRRSMLKRTVSVAALAIGSTFAMPYLARAAGAEFSYKFGTSLPASHPLNLQTLEASKAILSETGGRVEIQVYPNSQLGGDTDMLAQTRSGGLEFIGISGAILSTLVPVAAIGTVGFAFKSYDEVWAAVDGDLGGHVRAAIAKVNLRSTNRLWDNGFRQITTSSRPINSASDLAGLKIRVPVSPLYVSMFKALGASPAGINLAEVYSALQTNIVEAQENPLAMVESTKFYEVQRYCALTNHVWDGIWFLCNARAWNALPTDLQAIVSRNLDAAALRQRTDVQKLNSNLQADLTSKGMKFTTPDNPPFRDALRKAGFYTDWRGKFGEEAWSLLEKSAGKLT
jgi:tripartite ATP-independent transporter DctP family solute receptor